MKKVAVWWHKITHYEYWPFNFFYFPVFFYFLYLAIKHRSFFFFTAANPGIEFGGMLGEKKWDIYQKLPQGSFPKTALCSPGISSKEALQLLYDHQISFPFIAKPNIGERGQGVEKIDTLPALHRYLAKAKADFLVQEFMDFEVELGVFYVRMPNDSSGTVTSVTLKEFLTVTGNGKDTVHALLQKDPRAALTFDFNHPDFQEIKGYIPDLSESVMVQPIGNHCRGTTFLDITESTREKIEPIIDPVAKQFNGFYFGRFDIRCQSLSDFYENKNWSILELNGAGAEPGHIYQPGFGIFNAYREITRHLKFLSTIARINRRQGEKYWSLRDGLAKMKEIRDYNRLNKS